MLSRGKENTTIQWPEMKPAPPVISLHTSDALTIARVIVTNALEWVSAKLRCDKDLVVECLNRGDMAARRELKLGLARYLAEYLGFLDEDVKAVYVSDHVDNSDGEMVAQSSRWVIHLVVYAEPKTAALTSLLGALNRALTTALRKSVECAEIEGFLDVQLINSADLENLARYAALLNAPSYRPTRVWQREPPASSSPERSAISGKRKAVVAKV